MGCWRVNGTYAVSRAIGKSCFGGTLLAAQHAKLSHLVLLRRQTNVKKKIDSKFKKKKNPNCFASRAVTLLEFWSLYQCMIPVLIFRPIKALQ